ncbi:hypothetical protein C4K68_21225 [Pokkaliibacter plantistimulans]|uniref:Uncharacterized protein n=1 Tax=Proteobacteria bacterium 228 TaxID=2083153 RepID=A0A2S5KLH3_9PROT|nr:hypothetical protein [Pokkaliibacter plantistimulans]PPC75166.1 hypothetical protein C4K68_21225 [Pokkaliibacter plantistimulans]
MTSDARSNLETDLKTFIHDLFIKKAFHPWLLELPQKRPSHWYSLIADLDRSGCTVSTLQQLGEEVYQPLVYQCIKSPAFNANGQYLVLFHLSDSMYSQIVFMTPVPSA